MTAQNDAVMAQGGRISSEFAFDASAMATSRVL